METFNLVSKITAKHLYARLQGKPIPVEKAKPADESGTGSRSRAGADAAPNPFADSVPFPESQIDSSYEQMEEVSLEQLLSEGRERPATMSGNVPLPVDFEDVEELDAEAMVAVDDTAVAVMDEPAPTIGSPALEQKVTSLQSELDSVREEHRVEIEEILRDLGELTTRVAPAPRFLTCQQPPLTLQSPNILFGGTKCAGLFPRYSCCPWPSRAAKRRKHSTKRRSLRTSTSTARWT